MLPSSESSMISVLGSCSWLISPACCDTRGAGSWRAGVEGAAVLSVGLGAVGGCSVSAPFARKVINTNNDVKKSRADLNGMVVSGDLKSNAESLYNLGYNTPIITLMEL